MGAIRGIITGTLAVSALEVVLSSPTAPGRLGQLGEDLGFLIAKVVSPDVPAIANHSAAHYAGETSTQPTVLHTKRRRGVTSTKPKKPVTVTA